MKNFSIPSLKVTTKFIAPGVSSVVEGFGFQDWPKEIGNLDLGGGRVLDIIPIPGHTADAIVVYDRQTGLLLTGDSVYPGRIFIPQSAIRDFKESHKRLLHFVKTNEEKGREISWILGCHIEQKKTPFEEYPLGTRYQPDEHVLQFNLSILEDVEEGLKMVKEGMTPRQFMFAEFSLVIPEVKDEGSREGRWDWGGQQPLII
jgi:hydroxyacylglutathione hydrolase